MIPCRSPSSTKRNKTEERPTLFTTTTTTTTNTTSSSSSTTAEIFNSIAIEEIGLGNFEKAIELLSMGLQTYRRSLQETVQQQQQQQQQEEEDEEEELLLLETSSSSSSSSSSLDPTENELAMIDEWMLTPLYSSSHQQSSSSSSSAAAADVVATAADPLFLDENEHGDYYFYIQPIAVVMPPMSPSFPPWSSSHQEQQQQQQQHAEYYNYYDLSYPAIRTAIALTFNLGICFYRLAQQQEQQDQDQDLFSLLNRKTMMLSRSLSFFENSFRLQRTQCPHASDSPIFYTAVINNMGVLSDRLLVGTTSTTSDHGGIDDTSDGTRQKQYSQQATECFHQLVSLLMMYMGTSSSSTTTSTSTSTTTAATSVRSPAGTTTTTTTPQGHHQHHSSSSFSYSDSLWEGYFHNVASRRPSNQDCCLLQSSNAAPAA